MPLDKYGLDGIAVSIGLPRDVTEAGLNALAADGCIQINADVLLMPNFLEAQEARQSDRARQAESRARRRDKAKLRDPVTLCDNWSQNVTECHTRSHAVTPSLAVPSLAVPSRADPISSASADAPAQLVLVPPEPTATPEDMQRMWNDGTNAPCPKWRDMTDARRKKAQKRIEDHAGSLDFWDDAIAKVNASAFLRGEKGWRAAPDWMLEVANLTKVLEGNYDDNSKRGGFHEITEQDRTAFKTKVGIIDDF